MTEQQPEKRSIEDTQRDYYHATYELMKSIEAKLNFIVWVIVIAILLQILFGLRIL